MLSPALTIIDGIYSLEYGPSYIGDAHRSNLIIVSNDMISADKVGAKLLGYEPESIPHIALAAKKRDRALDLSDINLKGNVEISDAAKLHNWSHERNETDDMPLLFEQMGIKGITFPNVDDTICTYCAGFIGYIILGILMSKTVDKSFDDIEILYGKIQEPSGNKKNTLLVGQCQVNLNGKNPAINNCHSIHGCPPSQDDFINVFSELGIELPDNPKKWMDTSSEFFATKYAGQPDYEEMLYKL